MLLRAPPVFTLFYVRDDVNNREMGKCGTSKTLVMVGLPASKSDMEFDGPSNPESRGLMIQQPLRSTG